MNWWLLLALMLVVLDVGVFVIARNILHWQGEGARLFDSGHVPPKVSRMAKLARLLFGRYMKFRFVGPVRVLNEHYLHTPGRKLILCNHQIEKDAPMVMYLFDKLNFRYLIASTQVSGTRVPIAAWTGAIVVDHKNNPSGAVRMAVKVLGSEDDSSLVVFPQGMLVRDNNLKREEFAAGALMIAKLAQKKSKEPFEVLTMAIDYDRDPSHATPFHKLLRFLGFRHFRSFFGEQTYRAAVAFGEPIPFAKLPSDLDEGMDVVFARIKELAAEAKKMNDGEKPVNTGPAAHSAA
jgi:1-acyl-sn-glycerol-3-phosphate acyltransferase